MEVIKHWHGLGERLGFPILGNFQGFQGLDGV